MNLLSGLEKFGLDVPEDVDIFEKEKEKSRKAESETKPAQEEIPAEESFILEKKVTCPVCDHTFKTKVIKSGQARRLEPDKDLRPRHRYIDTLKYDMCFCSNCGYTALHRNFPHISPTQRKLLKEQVCANFHPRTTPEPSVYDYDTAIERSKLALFNTIVKKGKMSERAYTCLKIAWLYRGKAETMGRSTEAEKRKLAECMKEEEVFYQQAYDGFLEAVSTEMFPICGMDQGTMDYLLATMSMHYQKYSVASKCLAEILSSHTASRHLKDKALELKQEVLAELRQERD